MDGVFGALDPREPQGADRNTWRAPKVSRSALVTYKKSDKRATGTDESVGRDQGMKQEECFERKKKEKEGLR